MVNIDYMLASKKSTVIEFENPEHRKQLEQLYARRTAITAIIKSLERYDRFRDRGAENTRRKTA